MPIPTTRSIFASAIFIALVFHMSQKGQSLAALPATSEPSDEQLLKAEAFKDSKSDIELHLPKLWVPKKGIEDTGLDHRLKIKSISSPAHR